MWYLLWITPGFCGCRIMWDGGGVGVLDNLRKISLSWKFSHFYNLHVLPWLLQVGHWIGDGEWAIVAVTPTLHLSVVTICVLDRSFITLRTWIINGGYLHLLFGDHYSSSPSPCGTARQGQLMGGDGISSSPVQFSTMNFIQHQESSAALHSGLWFPLTHSFSF